MRPSCADLNRETLQLTANPLRGFSTAELWRYMLNWPHVSPFDYGR